MSYVRIWIHAVFSTHERMRILNKEGRDRLFVHIKERCKEKNIYLDFIGGYTEHIHLLISLGKTQNIADIMQQIKGESSFWANKNKIFPYKLKWQDDYFAASISHSQIETVRKYISNQEIHHCKRTFIEEIDEFMQKYNWTYVNESK